MVGGAGVFLLGNSSLGNSLWRILFWNLVYGIQVWEFRIYLRNSSLGILVLEFRIYLRNSSFGNSKIPR